MEQYFSHYFDRIRKVKKTAQSKQVLFSIAFLNSIGLAYLISWKLAFYSWIYLGDFEMAPAMWEILSYLPFMYMVLLSATVLDKITLLIVHISSIGQKLFFKLIQEFDLYYWRKTRRQGPLSEGLFRFQQRMISLDPLTKRRIIAVTVAIILAYYCLKIEGFQL